MPLTAQKGWVNFKCQSLTPKTITGTPIEKDACICFPKENKNITSYIIQCNPIRGRKKTSSTTFKHS
jgi:hypothetical protein